MVCHQLDAKGRLQCRSAIVGYFTKKRKRGSCLRDTHNKADKADAKMIDTLHNRSAGRNVAGNTLARVK